MANFNPSNSVSFIPRKKILLTLGIISTVLFCLAPVFWQLLTSFKTNAAISTVPNIYFPSLEQLTFQHYLSLGSQFLRYIFNSAFVSIISTLLCLTLGAPAAYALTRLKLPGENLILVLILIITLFPYILLFMGLLELIKFFHIGNNYLALIIPYTAINLPLTILILRTFFQQLPKDLEDSAKIDGYNTLSMLLNIVLPLTLPALVTTGILTFIFAWNEFIFALTFITRVALGRALVRNPEVFLLDEPLSNLDALLREQVRADLKQLFNSQQKPVVYVTHDQTEALTLSSKIAVLHQGYLQQLASPSEIYNAPANQFVAGFVGSPQMNLIRLNCRENYGILGEFQIPLPELKTQPSQIILGIRPEDIYLENREDSVNLEGKIFLVEDLGKEKLLNVRITQSHETIRFLVPAQQTWEGETIKLSLSPQRIHWFDSESGDRLS